MANLRKNASKVLDWDHPPPPPSYRKNVQIQEFFKEYPKLSRKVPGSTKYLSQESSEDLSLIRRREMNSEPDRRIPSSPFQACCIFCQNASFVEHRVQTYRDKSLEHSVVQYSSLKYIALQKSSEEYSKVQITRVHSCTVNFRQINKVQENAIRLS